MWIYFHWLRKYLPLCRFYRKVSNLSLSYFWSRHTVRETCSFVRPRTFSKDLFMSGVTHLFLEKLFNVMRYWYFYKLKILLLWGQSLVCFNNFGLKNLPTLCLFYQHCKLLPNTTPAEIPTALYLKLIFAVFLCVYFIYFLYDVSNGLVFKLDYVRGFEIS